jgi:hypothetical protein
VGAALHTHVESQQHIFPCYRQQVGKPSQQSIYVTNLINTRFTYLTLSVWQSVTLCGTTLQRKSHLCIPFLEIAWPQSQFPHSCVCEQFIYSQVRSTYFLQQKRQIDRGNTYINRSQTQECGYWDCGCAIHFLGRFVSNFQHWFFAVNAKCFMFYWLLSLKRRVFTVHGRVARPKSTSYFINTIKAPTFATVRP